ncbi:histidine phosphatase family protein [Salipiger sp. IMCC34102]|uniref:SixA phosphatase family protein n=1 Tax=Salipiger sp. IMCC34102 TaxID=2510647 RepID=UPI00101DA903|nr:histidine phosphatase family protein [Salipiger sp. IMCC34102]RYH04405.1 histidine phosphatase family protein [Salipiger sp. IMCC34102]
MSRRLILIRHGKSGWANGEEDHDRTLTDSGRQDATRMGRWLRDEGFTPDVILCSSATRTRQTEAALSLGPEPKILDPLYQSSPDQILSLLAQEDAATVAVIAHNPGIGDLAARLAATPPDAARFSSYPTCATTVLSFEADDWSQVKDGQVLAFRTPRDFKD